MHYAGLVNSAKLLFSLHRHSSITQYVTSVIHCRQNKGKYKTIVCKNKSAADLIPCMSLSFSRSSKKYGFLVFAAAAGPAHTSTVWALISIF